MQDIKNPQYRDEGQLEGNDQKTHDDDKNVAPPWESHLSECVGGKTAYQKGQNRRWNGDDDTIKESSTYSLFRKNNPVIVKSQP
jgi:hypothetical protein